MKTNIDLKTGQVTIHADDGAILEAIPEIEYEDNNQNYPYYKCSTIKYEFIFIDIKDPKCEEKLYKAFDIVKQKAIEIFLNLRK